MRLNLNSLAGALALYAVLDRCRPAQTTTPTATATTQACNIRTSPAQRTTAPSSRQLPGPEPTNAAE